MGSEKAGAEGYQDTDQRASGTIVLDLDRWQHPSLARHLQEDVGVQERIRRGGTESNPPENILTTWDR